MNREEVHNQVYDLVRQIPRGKVATYGDVAKVLGINPRYVGHILHNNPAPGEIPCHRIVNSEGRIAASFAFGGGLAQQQLLEAEGIIFKNGKMKLTDFRHFF